MWCATAMRNQSDFEFGSGFRCQTSFIVKLQNIPTHIETTYGSSYHNQSPTKVALLSIRYYLNSVV